MKRIRLMSIGIIIVLPSLALPYSKTSAAREAAEYILSKFGKEAAEEGVEGLARKIEHLALKYGDEAVMALRKVGPMASGYIDEAGEYGVDAVKLLARHGDDAVWGVAKTNRLAIFAKNGDDAAVSMIKHREGAEPLLTEYGQSAAGALKGVSPRNDRRLAMMEEDGVLGQSVGRRNCWRRRRLTVTERWNSFGRIRNHWQWR